MIGSIVKEGSRKFLHDKINYMNQINQEKEKAKLRHLRTVSTGNKITINNKERFISGKIKMVNKKFNGNPWGYDQTKGLEKENNENDLLQVNLKKHKKE